MKSDKLYGSSKKEMKIKSNLLNLIIVIILFSSCTQKEDSGRKIRKISFIPTEMSECYLEEIMESYFFIPLATNSEFLIKDIDKLYLTDNELIVVDVIQQSIFVFDRQGNSKYKISAKGKGPGDYSLMTDVFFDDKMNQFEVLDPGSQKILYYKINGDFLFDKKIQDSRLTGFRFIKYKGLYIFDRVQQDRDGMRISIYDEEKMSFIKSFLPIPTQILNFGYRYPHTLDIYGDSVYYLPMMDDKIYTVTLDSLLPAYELDYPGKTIIDQNGSEILRDLGSYRNYMIDHGHLYSVCDLFINDHFIYLKYGCNNHSLPIKLFYSKATGKLKQYESLKSLKNPKLVIYSSIKAKDGDYLVMSLHESLNKYLPDTIARNLDENSNPVLLFFKLRDF